MGSREHPRPVSGEIMTGATGSPARMRPFGAAEVHEAEYVTIGRPVHPSVLCPSGGTCSNSGASAGIGLLRRDRPRGRETSAKAPRGGAAFWLIGLLVAGGAFWVSGGHAMFDLPAWAAEKPLRIENIRSRVERHANGTAVLFVDGSIANDGARERAVPPLALDVTTRSGRIARYNLGTSGGRIAAGGSFAFSGRFEAPMEGVETVSVSFRED